jgi:hypothetical protein
MNKNAGIREKGWPRAFIDSDIERFRRGPRGYRTVRLQQRRPNIWLGGDAQRHNDWLSFDATLEAETEAGHVCVVCGEELSRLRVFGKTGAFLTNGPPAHPRCFALALKFCPHFTEPPYTHRHYTLAYVWDGGENWANAALTQPWYKDTERSGLFLLSASGKQIPQGSHNTDYFLVRRRVRALKRESLVHLARKDPLGVGDMTAALASAPRIPYDPTIPNREELSTP